MQPSPYSVVVALPQRLPDSISGTDQVLISFCTQIGSSSPVDGVCLADMLDHEIRTQILYEKEAIVLSSHTERIRICIAWPGYQTRVYTLPLPLSNLSIAGQDQTYQCRRSYLVKGLVKAFKKHIDVSDVCLRIRTVDVSSLFNEGRRARHG
ncbi:hypothetical protein DENSPDRAFT_845856 [Dentipellis sp. KUC8613]|nr:hypothetical protein DENSPDRAFT_845856 [Dentipellis sp. KUC8613]